MKKRRKEMGLKEFEDILKKEWTPCEIKKTELPIWAQGIPQEKIHSFYASGSIDKVNPELDGNKTAKNQIGGIDVYRFGEERDGVLLNKDHYKVLIDPDDDEKLIIAGPNRDSEHWIDQLPERLMSLSVSLKNSTE